MGFIVGNHVTAAGVTNLWSQSTTDNALFKWGFKLTLC